MTTPEYQKASAVAKRLDVSIHTVYRMIRSGELKGAIQLRQPKGSWLIPVEAVDRIIAPR